AQPHPRQAPQPAMIFFTNSNFPAPGATGPAPGAAIRNDFPFFFKFSAPGAPLPAPGALVRAKTQLPSHFLASSATVPAPGAAT
ncbi:hypothetical protein A2U01_0086950, partial [Trifolium medium]|nr:hypothetical protein [Trifolium medium]